MTFEEWTKLGLEEGLDDNQIISGWEEMTGQKFETSPLQKDVGKETIAKGKPPIVIGGQQIDKPLQYPSKETPLLHDIDYVNTSINPQSYELAASQGMSKRQYAAQVSVSKFFMDRLGLTPQEASQNYLRLGRAMFEDYTLDSVGVYERLQGILQAPTYTNFGEPLPDQDYEAIRQGLKERNQLSAFESGLSATSKIVPLRDPNMENDFWSRYDLKQRSPTQEESLRRFDYIMETAKWRQVDIPQPIADQLEHLYKSDAIDHAVYYGGVAPRSLWKAFAGLVVNIGDKVNVDTTWTEGTLEQIAEYETDYLEDSLLSGNINNYLFGSVAQAGGDIAANIWLMSQGLKSFNALTGSNFSLFMPAKTRAEYTKGVVGRALLIANMAALNTEGSLKKQTIGGVPYFVPNDEAINNYGLVLSYALSPTFSSTAPTKSLAVLGELSINSGIDLSYSAEKQSLQAGGQYADAFDRGRNYYVQAGGELPSMPFKKVMRDLYSTYGTPEQKEAQRQASLYAEMLKFQLAESVPIMGATAFFSRTVQSVRGQGELAMYQNFTNPNMRFRTDSAIQLRDYTASLEAKYGSLWRAKMTEAEGMRINELAFIDGLEVAKPAVDVEVYPRMVPKKYTDHEGVIRNQETGTTLTINDLAPREQGKQISTTLEQMEVGLRSDGKLQLTHFSPTADLEFIDPEFAGTGPLIGRETFRGGPKKVYFGLEGYNKEALGDNRYISSIELDRLYPIQQDPLNLRKEDLGETEQAIKDAGFDGFVSQARNGPVAVLFKPMQVEASFTDNVRVATSGNLIPNKLDTHVEESIAQVKEMPAGPNGNGATYNLDGTPYRDGGLVVPFMTLKVDDKSIIQEGDVTSANVLKLIQDNSDAIVSEQVKSGIYKFPDGSGYSVDLNIVVPKQYQNVALRFAAKAGQESLYDLGSGETIPTGEDGSNVKEFSTEEYRTIQTYLSKGKMPPVFTEEIKPSKMEQRAEQVLKALEGLEETMMSDKRTEVITTDAELREFAPDKGKTKVKKGDIIPRKPRIEQSIIEYNEFKKSLQYLAKSSKKSAKAVEQEVKAAEKIKADLRVETEKAKREALKVKQRKLKEEQKKKAAARKEELQKIKTEATERAMNIVRSLTDDPQLIKQYEKQVKAIGTSDKRFMSFIEKAYKDIPRILDQRRRNDAVAILTKKIPSIDYAYEKSIKEITSSINFTASEKELARIEATLNYMLNNPDNKLPESVIKKLSKIPLQDIDTNQLVALANEKQRLEQLGKTKLRIRREQLKREQQEIIDDIVIGLNERLNQAYDKSTGAILFSPTSLSYLFKDNKFYNEYATGFRKNKPTLKFEAIRPQRMFDFLDGGRATFDGPMFNMFVNVPNRVYADMVETRSARYEGYNLLLQRLSESGKSLGAPVVIDGVKYERRQIAGAYALSKNRMGRAALIHGNFKNMNNPEAHLQKILDMVETDINLKTIADYLMFDFQNNQARVEKVYGLTENQILTLEENYFTLERRDVPMETPTDFLDALTKVSSYTKTLPSNKFVLDRVEGDEFQSPVNLNIDYVWTRQVGMQEHYIHHAELAKTLNAVSTNRALRENVEKMFGPKAVKYIDRQVQLINNPNGIYKNQSDLELISRMLRKNTAAGALGLNFKTMTKQFPSINYYLGETTPAKLIEAFNTASLAFEKGGQNSVLNFVAEKDPLIAESVVARELAEMRIQSPDKYNQFMNKVGELGFKGIVEVDRFVRSVGWLAVYNNKLELGFSEQEAIDAARNATLRTQPTARPADLPLMYTTDEFLNWSLMFSNQLNQMYNMTTYDVPRRLSQPSQFMSGVMQTIGLSMSAMTMWQINNGRVLPDEKEDLFKEVFADQFIAQLPLVGGPILQGYKGYNFDQPIISTFEDSGRIMFKLADGQEVTSEDYFNLFLYGIAPFTGAPTVFTRRTVDALTESPDPISAIKEITGIKEPKK